MMSSTNEEDPFLQVQADVLSQLSTTRSLFTSYLRIRSLQSTHPTNPKPTSKSPSSTKSQPPPTPSVELTAALSELRTSLSTLAEDLADLVASVKAVQSDPYKYGLEIEEVARRKRVVDEVGAEVEEMHEQLLLHSSNANNTFGNGNGNRRQGQGGDRFADEEEVQDYNAEFEHQQQTQMMAEQDTQLDSVFHTVGNLRQQASDMGRELEEQAEMLDHVDGLADRVGGRLQGGLKSMGTVIRRNEDGLSSCCIGVLVFVLCLLLVLVLIL